MAAPYERKWVVEPKISMPTTIIPVVESISTIPTPAPKPQKAPPTGPRKSIALTYERQWVAEPKISMPTTLPATLPPIVPTPQATQRTYLPPLRTSTLPPMASKAYSPLSTASYERKWVPGPKIGMPTTVVVEPTVIPPPRTPSPTCSKAPRQFVPALPSNPRPSRRASEDDLSQSQGSRPKLSRSTTSAPRRPRRYDDDDLPSPDFEPRRRNRATSNATRPPSRSRSTNKSPKLVRRMTDAAPSLPPLRIPSPERRKNSDAASAPAEKPEAVVFPSSVVLSKSKIDEVEEETRPLPQDSTSQKESEPEVSLSPRIETNEPAAKSMSSQDPISPRKEINSGMESPMMVKEIVVSQKQNQAEENSMSSPESVIFSPGEIIEVTEKMTKVGQGFELPKLEFQEPESLYLRVVDIPPSQRSSDTMPAGYSLEATNEDGKVMSVTPGKMTASTMLESLGAADLPSPPTSGDESSPALTPVAETRPILQPAPLSLKTQTTEPVFVMEKPKFTPPAKTPTPPPESSPPPMPSPQYTKSPPKRASSVKFRSSGPNETPRRRASNASSFAPLAPRSLTTNLLALENTPRKLYLATNAPFLRLMCAPKANKVILSAYLSQERLYLHSTLRLLSLLLANVILPNRPTGLIAPRRGGVRERQRREIEKQERDRQGENAEESIAEKIENVHSDVGERAVDFVISAIKKARRTLDLIEEIEEDIPAIDLDASQNGGNGEMTALSMFSRLYNDIGTAVEKREKSVLAGLVMLFAREKAHLTAWLNVKSNLSLPNKRPPSISISQQKHMSQLDKGAVRMYLLPELTSDESISYVEDLGKLVDDLWADKFVVREQDRAFLERRDLKEKRRLKGIDWESEGRLCEGLWEMVLDIQGRFWPVV